MDTQKSWPRLLKILLAKPYYGRLTTNPVGRGKRQAIWGVKKRERKKQERDLPRSDGFSFFPTYLPIHPPPRCSFAAELS